MRRIEAMEKLVGLFRDEIVLTSIGGVNTELYSLGDRELNLYVSTNMGSAAAMGIGLALALPTEPGRIADPFVTVLPNGLRLIIQPESISPTFLPWRSFLSLHAAAVAAAPAPSAS